MPPDSDAILILVTAPDQKTAETIARELITERLAACVNIFPGITSIYRWEGAVQQDQEVLMLIKSTREVFQDRLIPLVQQLHPYDLPEIISLPLADSEAGYLGWWLEQTRAG